MGSLIFVDNTTHADSSKIDLHYRNTNVQRTSNKIVRKIMQQDNDHKHTANTRKDFIRGKSGRF